MLQSFTQEPDIVALVRTKMDGAFATTTGTGSEGEAEHGSCTPSMAKNRAAAILGGSPSTPGTEQSPPSGRRGELDKQLVSAAPADPLANTQIVVASDHTMESGKPRPITKHRPDWNDPRPEPRRMLHCKGTCGRKTKCPHSPTERCGDCVPGNAANCSRDDIHKDWPVFWGYYAPIKRYPGSYEPSGDFCGYCDKAKVRGWPVTNRGIIIRQIADMSDDTVSTSFAAVRATCVEDMNHFGDDSLSTMKRRASPRRHIDVSTDRTLDSRLDGEWVEYKKYKGQYGLPQSHGHKVHTVENPLSKKVVKAVFVPHTEPGRWQGSVGCKLGVRDLQNVISDTEQVHQGEVEIKLADAMKKLRLKSPACTTAGNRCLTWKDMSDADLSFGEEDNTTVASASAAAAAPVKRERKGVKRALPAPTSDIPQLDDVADEEDDEDDDAEYKAAERAECQQITEKKVKEHQEENVENKAYSPLSIPAQDPPGRDTSYFRREFLAHAVARYSAAFVLMERFRRLVLRRHP